ncbi:MAG: hypothetical protein M1838_001895 [Thelocarpon superellum]|nr:MAG: hypothetical protein M1838_001895 [Thelocarpon superellum]
MEAFVSRKRRRFTSPETSSAEPRSKSEILPLDRDGEEDSTEIKLAVLASLHPYVEAQLLLDFLLANDGSVEATSRALSNPGLEDSPRKKSATGSLSYQSSISRFAAQPSDPTAKDGASLKPLTRKGKTLHLYAPEDVAAHTPCSIVHHFLPVEEANSLLRELLDEASTFGRYEFKLFENVVSSPHSASFYVQSLEEAKAQRTDYLYNGRYLQSEQDIRQITPRMRDVSPKVQEAVNEAVATRIKTHSPDGKKLKYQSPHPWIPNAAFVNCYNGGHESVGYHADQLTYLGPRAIIGSLSLGVAREFRVRRIVPRDDVNESDETANNAAEQDPSGPIGSGKSPTARARADAEGQIAIHLPHNSLLVMHAEMQEEWKHSIAPAQAIDPHPIAGAKRINVTYRHYRDSFHPRHTPRCQCNVACVLRCVQRKKENAGRYFWMCDVGNNPVGADGKKGCPFFQWAEFDDDGEPVAKAKAKAGPKA